LVLEIASGSGEHALHFAAHFPALSFQPSDPDAAALASIAAWREEARLPNLLPPLMLDVMADAWPIQTADAVLCINMIHIAPWEATAALMRGAARILPPDGKLFLYGPFKQGGAHTAPSNATFDDSLRSQDARWGVRDLEAVARTASAAGFAAPVVEVMPANNLSVIFHRLP
jgi:SAM-dependent methyltransferase